MRLAHISIAGRGETDRFLAAVAARLEMAGLRLAGTVQSNTARADRTRCDMDLRVLPDGPVYRISEDRGAAARGCMLDHGALEQTVAEVARRMDGADLLIVNKFGKAESEGRGLVPVISDALARGLTITPGSLFSPSGRHERHIRLSGCYNFSDRHVHALMTLGELAQAQLDG